MDTSTLFWLARRGYSWCSVLLLNRYYATNFYDQLQHRIAAKANPPASKISTFMAGILGTRSISIDTEKMTSLDWYLVQSDIFSVIEQTQRDLQRSFARVTNVSYSPLVVCDDRAEKSLAYPQRPTRTSAGHLSSGQDGR